MSDEVAAAFAERVLPHPDEVSAEYWAALRRSELAVQFCAECSRYIHPPRARCPGCRSGHTLGWRTVSGRGRIHAAARVTREFSVGIPVPYVPIEVELEEQRDLVMWSKLSGSDEVPAIGTAVTAVFDRVADGVTLVNFAVAE